MTEFKTKLQSEAGLTEEQADKTVVCINEYLKSKLPDFAADKITNIFTGKKIEVIEKIQDAAGNFINKTDNFAEEIGNIADDAIRKLNDYLNKPKDS